MTEIFRIEGSGVDSELVEGLASRVADPLWYLARQWQLGEFRGEDAASPVIVEAEIDSYPIDAYWVGKSTAKTEETRAVSGPPLEALAERDHADVHDTVRSRLGIRRLAAPPAPSRGHPRCLRRRADGRISRDHRPEGRPSDPVGLERLRSWLE